MGTSGGAGMDLFSIQMQESLEMSPRSFRLDFRKSFIPQRVLGCWDSSPGNGDIPKAATAPGMHRVGILGLSMQGQGLEVRILVGHREKSHSIIPQFLDPEGLQPRGKAAEQGWRGCSAKASLFFLQDLLSLDWLPKTTFQRLLQLALPTSQDEICRAQVMPKHSSSKR